MPEWNDQDGRTVEQVASAAAPRRRLAPDAGRDAGAGRVSDYHENEDTIIACATVVFVIAVLIGAVVLASGHGIYMPPASPTVSAGETTAP